MQFEASYSHRGFSPVADVTNQTGNRFNVFHPLAAADNAGLKLRRE